jgi:hypothetical protein
MAENDTERPFLTPLFDAAERGTSGVKAVPASAGCEQHNLVRHF